jgi:ATP-dependent protease HslVU (ClpYQ) peptidase subunit
MTTIVYDHKNKQIACDSRETGGGTLFTDSAIKHRTVNGDVWFICGSKSDVTIFIDTFEHNSFAPENVECGGLVVRKGIAYKACNDDGVYKLDELPCNESLGSGGWFAMAAVDLGKTARESVEYAMTRDVYSGGKIHVYDIEKGEFI